MSVVLGQAATKTEAVAQAEAEAWRAQVALKQHIAAATVQQQFAKSRNQQYRFLCRPLRPLSPLQRLKLSCQRLRWRRH